MGPAALDAGLPLASLGELLAHVAAGTSVTQVAGMTPAIQHAVHGRLVFLATIPFSVVLLVAACLVPNMRLLTWGTPCPSSNRTNVTGHIGSEPSLRFGILFPTTCKETHRSQGGIIVSTYLRFWKNSLAPWWVKSWKAV